MVPSVTDFSKSYIDIIMYIYDQRSKVTIRLKRTKIKSVIFEHSR